MLPTWLRQPRMRPILYLVLGDLVLLVLWAVLWLTGAATGFGFMFLNVNVTALVFLGAWWLVRYALARLPSAPFAVARTVLDESLHWRITFAFIGLILIALPLSPLLMSDDLLLRFRVQSFLDFSIGASFVLLALLAVFFSCATLSLETENRRIQPVLVKPVHRGSYLLGKWLGVMALLGLLLLASGTAIYIGTHQLAAQPARNAEDRRIVEDELLQARAAHRPLAPADLDNRIARRVEKRRAELAREGVEQLPPSEQRRIVQEEQLQALQVPPGETREFVFAGLRDARRKQQDVQLRMRVAPADSNSRHVSLGVWVEGEERAKLAQYPSLHPHSRNVSWERIRPDGTLRLFVSSISREEAKRRTELAHTVQFLRDDGLMVLEPVGSFAPNLLRVLLVLWLKVGVLAAIGLTAATFMGFPVATLFTLVMLLGMSMGGFVLGEDIGPGHSHGDAAPSWVTTTVEAAGHGVATVLGQWGRLQPTPRLIEGRVVSWGGVGFSMLWLLGATAVIGLVGWLVFSRREIARVQV
jgi:ABC-type transport system involved in multi-copper enzyme maturation permease subunit